MRALAEVVGVVAGSLAIAGAIARHYATRARMRSRLRAKQAEADKANAEAAELRRQLEGRK